MDTQRAPRNRLLEGLALAAIILLAYFMASIPHLTYRYPLHIDEWTRYGQAQSIAETGRITYPSPFNAGETVSPDIEAGFHLFLAELQMITGVSWLNLFRFLPGIFLGLLAWQAYTFSGGGALGLSAALLVSLVPTTIRFLGPAFLLPSALGLTFIPLVLLVLERLMTDLRGPVILFLLLLFLLFMHPPTLAVIAAATIVYLLFYLATRDRTYRRQATLGLASLVLVFVVMLFWAPGWVVFIVNEASSPALHLPLPPIQGAISNYGFIPAALFALGAGILVYRGSRLDWALIVCAVGLLAYQIIYPRVYIGPDIVYERGWPYTFVFMSLLGAVAVVAIGGWLWRKSMQRKWRGVLSYGLVGILLAGALAVGLRNHLTESYYHVIDDVAYQDFLWVKQYMPDTYRVGVLDTAQAWAFADISGKQAYASEVAPNFTTSGRAAMAFLKDGARDADWLAARGISIVYSPGPVDNNRLIKVSHNLYLLVGE